MERQNELVAAARRAAFAEAARLCETQAHGIDGSLPDAHGGRFAKKFAANALRGASALIRKLGERRRYNRRGANVLEGMQLNERKALVDRRVVRE
jgi:hypothetical protein